MSHDAREVLRQKHTLVLHAEAVERLGRAHLTKREGGEVDLKKPVGGANREPTLAAVIPCACVGVHGKKHAEAHARARRRARRVGE